MLAGCDGNENGNAGFHRFRIEKGYPALDVAVFLQLLNTPPAGGRGQADHFADFRHRNRTVLLKNFEDLAIHFIK